MKVIFLDFDGVINTINPKKGFELILPIVNKNHRYSGSTYCDPTVLPLFSILIKFCNKYKVKIVISSTWRIGITERSFNNFFKTFFNHFQEYSYKERLVIGKTTTVSMDRGLQILKFIKDFNNVKKDKITHYVSIDDDGSYDVTKHIGIEHSVEVDAKVGLTKENILETFKKLEIVLDKEDLSLFEYLITPA